MHIFAFDEAGNCISAPQAERKKNYVCPECGSFVRVRGGLYRKTHFYHLHNVTSCKLGGKSLLHLTVQLTFASLLPECFLEKPFPQIKRIADCVWPEKKLIFEIQCSLIHEEEVKQRMIDYSSLGYEVVWILHDHAFHPKTMTSVEYYLKKFSHYYTDINLEGKGIIYDRYLFSKTSKDTQKYQINISQPLFPPFEKQFLSQLKERKKYWNICFEGDLLSKPQKVVKPRTTKKLPAVRFFKFLAHLLLQNL